ncbi:ribonucleotide-diphosphate reductase subunit alpha [Candidatus Bathyarchaeota archaeon]|nr:MAG: ribonucleotide-diphosphate reductase subunit alpha [Candidatus Bathyarchaeota archaeon]
MVVTKIRKRDGKIEEFNPEKITIAIFKALKSVGKEDLKTAQKLSGQVVSVVEEKFGEKEIPNVEEVQDIVETVLIKNGLADVAKSYILYRQKRSEVREAKKLLGVSDDLKLSVNATKVLRNRYLLRNEAGEIIETPKQMFRRVAKAIATVDLMYDKTANVEKVEEEFFRIMVNLEFLPNSPTLMNAGTELGQLSACFVLPVEDSIEGIFNAVKNMALIHKSGGGTGFSFSKLRPKGDVVRTTKGIASGPVSFMQIFDVSTSVIKQGGRRRGANMGVLSVYHPDILEFITAKSREGVLTNFNISVAVDDKFMEAVEKNEEYFLVNPRTGEKVKSLPAKLVFDLIVNMAWRTGDPGLIFLDEINRHNPTPEIGMIESTNPCGEQPLLPYESCNLGSINLTKVVEKGEINWEKLRRLVRVSVHFLDNVIDANRFPLPEIEQMTKANRKIGLGVMGWAETLIMLGIPYDSDEALKMAEKVMKFITEEARKKSVEMGLERGSFPNFERSIWVKKGFKALRNATVTTIAPTGTISIIADVTSGIEPLFAISYVRNVLEGAKLFEVNRLFEETARKRNFYSKDLMMEIAKKGSLKNIDGLPEDVKRIFVTALDIAPEWHVRMQAAFQKYTDNAVSKTINLPPEAGLEDVRKVFMLAYKLKCKGITVYRYGSKKEQVLSITPPEMAVLSEEPVTVESEYAGGCPVLTCLH